MGTGFEIVYENNLDTHTFARIFNNTSQSYKFYWFEAILNLTKETDEDLSFEKIIDEMICEAWHTVTHYHLRLGPRVNGNAENFLEHAINTLNKKVDWISQNPSRDELLSAISECGVDLKKDKTRLTDYVPYKLLYPFFDTEDLKEGLEYIKNDKHSRLIAYMAKLSGNENVFYTILDGSGLNKTIRLNRYWRELLLKNYSVIRSWVQYNKVQFLQDRNPGVPGIIYKLCRPDNVDARKLNQARDLWKLTVDITGKPIREIYTGDEIEIKELSIDHFIPRSYISNDELWNLIPMDENLNSSKNNKLPDWDAYYKKFCDNQYILNETIQTNEKAREKFEKCKQHNLNSIWPLEELYIQKIEKERFFNVLYGRLHPIYESAMTQGYDIWKN